MVRRRVAAEIEWYEAVVLGVVEGLTEFLPVSSTGHLTILESAFGLSVDDPDVTAFTAIIQVGAVLATLLFFRRDFARIVRAALRGLRDPAQRTGEDWRFAVAVAVGCIPIGVVGLAFKDTIETTLRSLWFVGGALVLWSFVMLYADRNAKQDRGEADVTWRDTLVIGAVQCLALVPGVSRSGATMSAGLLRGLDRVTVTRLSFFLSVPALSAAGLLQVVTEADTIAAGVGWGPTLLATAISFAVAYVAVAWLLRFIARHTYAVFIAYRIALGTLVLVLVATGVLAAQ
jgi:undecaprenyl-diphosphatase